MSKIVLDLQKKALSDCKISELLRYAYLVACKLKNDDFREWIDSEINGYKGDVPAYRKIKTSVVGYNQYTHAIVPVVNLSDIEVPVGFPMSSIESFANSSDSHIYFNVDFKLEKQLVKDTGYEMQFCHQYSKNQFATIIERVRHCILDWALKLEENGILGEDLSFTVDEIEKANNSSISQTYNLIFNGDVSNTQIGQGVTDSEFNKN